MRMNNAEIVLTFCKEIAPPGIVALLAPDPVPEAQPAMCFVNVLRHIERHGGELLCGWRTGLGLAGIYIAAQYHGIWRSPEGDLRDITPWPEPAPYYFAWDPALTYDGSMRDNKRKPFIDHPALSRLFAAQERLFEIQTVAGRERFVGKLMLRGGEAAEFERLTREVESSTRELVDFAARMS